MNIFQVLFTQPLTNGLFLFYKLLGGNLGVAIVVFSLTLRIVTSPLTKPYMESMKKMKSYSKDLEKIKARHKGDKQKLMQAQAEFYKQKGINPGAGCLPYLLQIVILIALFRVFTNVLGGSSDIGKLNQVLYPALDLRAGEQVDTKFLYLDLSKPDVFQVSGIPFSLPGILVIVAALVQFLSAKMMMPYVEAEEKMVKATKETADDIAVSMQASMIYTFPLLTLLAGVSFPSGLALYWLLFSLFQMFQQYRSGGWGGLTPLVRGWKKNSTPDTIASK